MEFRVNRIKKNIDQLLGAINGEIQYNVGHLLSLKSYAGKSGNGDGGTSWVFFDLLATPGRWRVVGIGGYITNDGASTVSEKCRWGYRTCDLGGEDIDSFGEVVMDSDDGKNWIAGDVIYQGVSPFDNFFGFDTPTNEGNDTWDISGEGAGNLMGEWQSKATYLLFSKANVAGSRATVSP
ncbi:MAG TPA: hypothetical protein EYP28_04860, partial [Methanophagales archaeon]|nr:hypothetical protein [Methanophagales archaeon]